MTKTLSKLLVAGVVTLGTVGTAQAQSLYGTAMIGGSFQATDSEPYGSNIAVDADFPGQFDAGDGTVGAIGLGYVVGSGLRVEGRLSFRNADFSSKKIGTGARAGEQYILDGSVSAIALTADVFYDFETGSSFKPYVKAGMGVSRNKYDARLGGTGVAAFDAFDGTADGFYDAYADGEDTGFTWNVGLGASYQMASGMTLFGEYQYVSIGEVQTGQDSFTDGFGIDATSHEVMIGVRTSF